MEILHVPTCGGMSSQKWLLWPDAWHLISLGWGSQGTTHQVTILIMDSLKANHLHLLNHTEQDNAC